jgi:hypothetical protein
MEKKAITLINEFHQTVVRTRVEVLGSGDLWISDKLASSLWGRLCGSKTCTCGNSLGMRPVRQEGYIVEPSVGGYYLRRSSH